MGSEMCIRDSSNTTQVCVASNSGTKENRRRTVIVNERIITRQLLCTKRIYQSPNFTITTRLLGQMSWLRMRTEEQLIDMAEGWRPAALGCPWPRTKYEATLDRKSHLMAGKWTIHITLRMMRCQSSQTALLPQPCVICVRKPASAVNRPYGEA